ncbi:MAG: MFS transporter [Treponema sp.]|jgi:oligogalacturonide transporter|nr:MFS transporter [Treponema sp.]
MGNNLKTKLCYASGDIYGGGAFMIFSLLFMNFLVLVEGLPVVATTIIIFIGKLWDAVTDPIVGRISDKTRSRFGRRRIYFLIGIVPVYLSFVMLFYSFGIESVTAKIIYYTFSYIFFGTAFTIVMVPYNAILSDMTSDYDERTSFTTMRMLLSGGASLLCAVIPGIIIKLTGGGQNGPEQIQGYLIMAIVFGAVFAASWLVAFLGTKEKENLPEPEKTTLKLWLSVFENKAYRNFLGIFLSFQIAVDLVLALFIFYIDIVVLQYRNYELVVGLLLTCSMLLITVMGAIAKRKGKTFPLYIGIPVWILSTVVFMWLDSSVSVVTLCVLAVLISAGTSAGQLSTWSMLTDIFDIDEIRTGTRREGIYSGITTFLRKFASGVAVLLMGIGLQAMGFDQNEYSVLKASVENFDPAVYAQSGIVSGIKWMFVIIPLILLTICLFFAFRNKINKRRFDAVLRGIDELKARGNIDGLSEQEKADVLIAAGIEKDKLWGGK